MFSDAEKYKKEDDTQRERISAKNSLESYCFNMKTSLNDDKISSKLSADDKSKANEIIESTLKWMDTNQTADKDEFEYRRKEVEKICSPIMTKLYQGGNPSSEDQNQSETTGTNGPTIEELD